jgi:hypothetical protein
MGRGRIEAFSDAVFAIIITIMVLEIKAPHGDRIEDVLPLLPVFLSYTLSFVFVAIYLNKPPSHAALVRQSHWNSVVGQPVPAVLALIASFCYRMDGVRIDSPRCRPRSTARYF